FFFSSRRRHTRWPRDWSSDVCSSDLAIKSSSARNHFATTWADRGVTRDHGRTVRTQLKISTFYMFLVENFRRFLRQVIISLGEEIGRASCRERVLMWVGVGSLKIRGE